MIVKREPRGSAIHEQLDRQREFGEAGADLADASPLVLELECIHLFVDHGLKGRA